VKHGSLHSYLESRFSAIDTVTDAMVIKAKREYRKHYLKQYHQTLYGKKRMNVTVSFTPADRFLLREMAAKSDKSLAGYIRELVLNGEITDHKTIDIAEIKRLFSMSFDMVEALQFDNRYPELRATYEKLEGMFIQIESLLK
tara:strand:- start:375105 stop:375530 length:426 start_codon:yes stop_codon:yes gene_type:complete